MALSKIEQLLIKCKYIFTIFFISAGCIILFLGSMLDEKYRDYPPAKYPEKIGVYPTYVNLDGGWGYYYDEVLEYRVWVHPDRGGEDLNEGSDYYYPFITYKEALTYSKKTKGAEEPIALVLQKEWLSETDGQLSIVGKERITEWNASWLKGNKRTNDSISEMINERKY
jgi:hypothetical protein